MGKKKNQRKEGRREREGKGREGKQAASLIREEERQRKERGRKGRKSLSVVWCFLFKHVDFAREMLGVSLTSPLACTLIYRELLQMWTLCTILGVALVAYRYTVLGALSSHQIGLSVVCLLEFWQCLIFVTCFLLWKTCFGIVYIYLSSLRVFKFPTSPDKVRHVTNRSWIDEQSGS